MDAIAREGGTLIVLLRDYDLDGRYCLCQVEGEENAIVRKYTETDGYITLYPDNFHKSNEFPPRTFTVEEAAEKLKVIGVVVESKFPL